MKRKSTATCVDPQETNSKALKANQKNITPSFRHVEFLPQQINL